MCSREQKGIPGKENSLYKAWMQEGMGALEEAEMQCSRTQNTGRPIMSQKLEG